MISSVCSALRRQSERLPASRLRAVTRAARAVAERRRPAQQQRERQHRHERRTAAMPKYVCAPAVGADEVLRRSAARRCPRGNCRSRRSPTAMPRRRDEPQRRMREQRRERRRAAGRRSAAPCASVYVPEARRERGGDVAERQQQACRASTGTMTPKRSDSRPITMPPTAEADHRQRVGQRRIGARDAELRLHRGQRDDDRPHADAADRRQRQRDHETHPRGCRFDFTV